MLLNLEFIDAHNDPDEPDRTDSRRGLELAVRPNKHSEPLSTRPRDQAHQNPRMEDPNVNERWPEDYHATDFEGTSCALALILLQYRFWNNLGFVK